VRKTRRGLSKVGRRGVELEDFFVGVLWEEGSWRCALIGRYDCAGLGVQSGGLLGRYEILWGFGFLVWLRWRELYGKC